MHYLTTILTAFVVVGSLVLIYYQSIDGTWNPPVTFSVDVNKLETDKTVYHRGDPVYVEFSYCRHRSFTATSQWKLVDDTIIPFAAQTYLLRPECKTDNYVFIGIIPPYSLIGTHHLEGETLAHINSLRTISYDYTTVNFQVVP